VIKTLGFFLKSGKIKSWIAQKATIGNRRINMGTEKGTAPVISPRVIHPRGFFIEAFL
jgi:hypothetical protein